MNEIKFTRISWNRFGELCDELYQKIETYLKMTGKHIDLIIPMMREGGFVALTLSYKLNTYKVLPLHSKHVFKQDHYEILQMADFPKTYYDIPQSPLILLVDVLSFSGKSGNLAYQRVKERFPRSSILFAYILKDYTTIEFEGFEKTFSVITADDHNMLSDEDAVNQGIDKHVYLFPWQNEEEEKASILQRDYQYSN